MKVAVPRHGLKRQGARPATSPRDTATTSTTIDSPTSSSVVLGKRPRRVVLERKKVVGCACCEFVDHVEHVDLHVELMLAWLLVTCRSFRTPPRTPSGC